MAVAVAVEVCQGGRECNMPTTQNTAAQERRKSNFSRSQVVGVVFFTRSRSGLSLIWVDPLRACRSAVVLLWCSTTLASRHDVERRRALADAGGCMRRSSSYPCVARHRCRSRVSILDPRNATHLRFASANFFSGLFAVSTNRQSRPRRRLWCQFCCCCRPSCTRNFYPRPQLTSDISSPYLPPQRIESLPTFRFKTQRGCTCVTTGNIESLRPAPAPSLDHFIHTTLPNATGWKVVFRVRYGIQKRVSRSFFWQVYKTPNGVTCIGYTDMTSRLANTASALFSNNAVKLFASAGPFTTG